MTEDEARQLVNDASNAEAKIVAEIGSEVDAATARIRAAHDGELRAARRVLAAARAVLRDLKDQTPDHPWTGKRVFKMVNQGRTWDRLPQKRVEAIVETARSTTEYPGNAARYSLPTVGDPFARLLNKDGKPGLRFDGMRGNHHGWKLAEEAANPAETDADGAAAIKPQPHGNS